MSLSLLVQDGSQAQGVSEKATQTVVPANPSQTITDQEQYREVINRNTITIMGASLSGAYIKIVDAIAWAVNDGHKLRVLPVVGEGGAQNIRDLLYLKGVDAGVLKLDSLNIYNGQPLFENLRNKVQYIARLYDEEFHIIGTPDMESISDLSGKKVGFHGGAYVSGRQLLRLLKIKPAEETQMNYFKGLELLKSGELSAVIRSTASPMNDLEKSFDPQFHKFIPVPFEKALLDFYLPTKLTHKQYPKIIPEGQFVETAANSVILAAYAWQAGTDRYRRVAQFTEAFFSKFDNLLENSKRHPKWDDVNLAAEMPGWKRFPAAEEWLQRNAPRARRPRNVTKSNFSTFLEEQGYKNLDEAQVTKLFQDFQRWQKSGTQ